jgi:hypothetical protein
MDFDQQLGKGLTVVKLDEIINSSDKREHLDVSERTTRIDRPM